MKVLMVMLGSFFVFFGSLANADRVVIMQSTPVVVEQQGDVYVPASAITKQSDYVFEVGGTKRVCYYETQPALAKIGAGTMAVRIGEDQVTLNCYDYSPEYFDITP